MPEVFLFLHWGRNIFNKLSVRCQDDSFYRCDWGVNLKSQFDHSLFIFVQRLSILFSLLVVPSVLPWLSKDSILGQTNSVFFSLTPHIFSLPFITGHTHIWDALPASRFPLSRGHHPITPQYPSSSERMDPPAVFGISALLLHGQSDWSAPLPPNERDYLCSCRKLGACPVKSLSALRLYLLPLDAGFHTETRVSYRLVMSKTGRSLRCWTVSLCVLYLLISHNYKENWKLLIGLMMCLYTVACDL